MELLTLFCSFATTVKINDQHDRKDDQRTPDASLTTGNNTQQSDGNSGKDAGNAGSVLTLFPCGIVF